MTTETLPAIPAPPPSGGLKKKGKKTRRARFSPELAARCIELVQKGNYLETAAAACGVAKITLYNWIRFGANAGRKPKAALLPYAEFYQKLMQAQGEAETRDLQRIDDAAKTIWQAAAWRLERKFPDRWGRKMEVAGPGGGPIRVQAGLHKLSEDELQQLQGLLAKIQDT